MLSSHSAHRGPCSKGGKTQQNPRRARHGHPRQVGVRGPGGSGRGRRRSWSCCSGCVCWWTAGSGSGSGCGHHRQEGSQGDMPTGLSAGSRGKKGSGHWAAALWTQLVAFSENPAGCRTSHPNCSPEAPAVLRAWRESRGLGGFPAHSSGAARQRGRGRKALLIGHILPGPSLQSPGQWNEGVASLLYWADCGNKIPAPWGSGWGAFHTSKGGGKKGPGGSTLKRGPLTP